MHSCALPWMHACMHVRSRHFKRWICSRCIPLHDECGRRRCFNHAAEVKQQIRQGFEVHRGETEEYACKFLLSDGRAQLKQLRETLMLQE
jgi:Complex 1 protein (LYR family)